MNKQYHTLKNQYNFLNLNNETDYKCQGGACTCKYTELNTKTRTLYDIEQKQKFQTENGTDYQANMFKRIKSRGTW